jgi:LmbE family N-acetylglucosaminyl deacetylase
LAKAKAAGAAIGILTLCQGDKGQPRPPLPKLAVLRRKEMTAAAKLLGAELFRGEFPDGELVDGPEQRKTLIETYRRFQPTLILAHAGEDYHPDHRAASKLAESASWFSASAGHESRSPPLDAPPALWWMDTVNMAGFLPGLYIDVTPFVELKRQMLACHRSQLARGEKGDFSPLEEQMLCQARARGAQAGVPAAEAFRAHLVWKRARAW